jgi:hypothetical protein
MYYGKKVNYRASGLPALTACMICVMGVKVRRLCRKLQPYQLPVLCQFHTCNDSTLGGNVFASFTRSGWTSESVVVVVGFWFGCL